MEILAQVTKDPWRIVLELEVVLGRRRQLVTSTIQTEQWASLVSCHQNKKRRESDSNIALIGLPYMSKANLWAEVKSSSTRGR